MKKFLLISSLTVLPFSFSLSMEEKNTSIELEDTINVNTIFENIIKKNEFSKSDYEEFLNIARKLSVDCINHAFVDLAKRKSNHYEKKAFLYIVKENVRHLLREDLINQTFTCLTGQELDEDTNEKLQLIVKYFNNSINSKCIENLFANLVKIHLNNNSYCKARDKLLGTIIHYGKNYVDSVDIIALFLSNKNDFIKKILDYASEKIKPNIARVAFYNLLERAENNDQNNLYNYSIYNAMNRILTKMHQEIDPNDINTIFNMTVKDHHYLYGGGSLLSDIIDNFSNYITYENALNAFNYLEGLQDDEDAEQFSSDLTMSFPNLLVEKIDEDINKLLNENQNIPQDVNITYEKLFNAICEGWMVSNEFENNALYEFSDKITFAMYPSISIYGISLNNQVQYMKQIKKNTKNIVMASEFYPLNSVPNNLGLSEDEVNEIKKKYPNRTVAKTLLPGPDSTTFNFFIIKESENNTNILKEEEKEQIIKKARKN